MTEINEHKVQELLETWETVYKKGLMSFWILLLLHERTAYAYEMTSAINELSKETISVEENSIYRALNRFESVGIVSSQLQQSDSGPNRRYYKLTRDGLSLLTKFIENNILVFELPSVAERIHAVLKNDVILNS